MLIANIFSNTFQEEHKKDLMKHYFEKKSSTIVLSPLAEVQCKIEVSEVILVKISWEVKGIYIFKAAPSVKSLPGGFKSCGKLCLS